MTQGKVGIVVACVDCRLHPEEQRLHTQCKEVLDADQVFVRTSAGPDGRILARDHHLQSCVEDIQLLIDAKGATVVGVVAHYDCAGHPVSNEQHDTDVVEAAKILQSSLNFEGDVVPLMAVPEGSRWIVKQVSADPVEAAA